MVYLLIQKKDRIFFDRRKMRVFTYINFAHAVPLLRQVRQHARQVLLNASQAKDASSDLGKVSVQNAQDMVDLVNVLINCIQWNGNSGHVIGQNRKEKKEKKKRHKKQQNTQGRERQKKQAR